MAIPVGHKANLQTIINAAKAGRLAAMECTEQVSGKVVHALCVVNHLEVDEGKFEYEFLPIAKFFDGNPFEELNPPSLTNELDKVKPKAKTKRHRWKSNSFQFDECIVCKLQRMGGASHRRYRNNDSEPWSEVNVMPSECK